MRYQIYQRKKFNRWRAKVKIYLPQLSAAFYRNGFDFEKAKLLGTVTREINNPEYGIIGNDGSRLDNANEMGAQVMLEILVEQLFSLVIPRMGRIRKSITL